MGRDLLSNEIYQQMKQLQTRLRRRNAEERRRQERVEKAKKVLWEEHQKQTSLSSAPSPDSNAGNTIPSLSSRMVNPSHSVRSETSILASSPQPSHTSDNSYGKSDLARCLEGLNLKQLNELDANSRPSVTLSEVYSVDMSPLPSLPSTPSEFQSPQPETPTIHFEIPQPSLPTISITKLALSSESVESQQAPAKKPKHPTKKKTPKMKKKKLLRKGVKLDLKVPKLLAPDIMVPEKPIISTKEAKRQINDIFNSVNSLPDDELTEEAFDIFLDSIKKLSEYVDDVHVQNSQKYEVIDNISSGFSSRVMDSADFSDMTSLTPFKMSDTNESARLRKEKTEEKRRQRILVVREKQAGLVRYRKITIAEIRLRRQRTLMRVRQKIVEDANERTDVELQRVRLFELAALNEQERLERLEQFRLEEESKKKEEEKKKLQKELYVKKELERILQRSKVMRLGEQDVVRVRACEGGVAEPTQYEETLTEEYGHRWKTHYETKKEETEQRKCRKENNRATYNKMLQQNSWGLCQVLLKELLDHQTGLLISDIPGFSYFFLIKYTMDPSAVEELMLDL